MYAHIHTQTSVLPKHLPWPSRPVYRIHIENLSNVGRPPIDHLSIVYRTYIDRQSNTYRLSNHRSLYVLHRTSVDRLSTIYRLYIEHISTVDRTPIGCPIIEAPTCLGGNREVKSILTYHGPHEWVHPHTQSHIRYTHILIHSHSMHVYVYKSKRSDPLTHMHVSEGRTLPGIHV